MPPGEDAEYDAMAARIREIREAQRPSASVVRLSAKRHFIMLALCQLGGSAAAAEHVRRKVHGAAVTEADVELAFIASDVEHILCPESDDEKAWLEEAEAWVREADLRGWISRANRAQGVAPSSSQVLVAAAARGLHPPPCEGTALSSAERSWTSRFRKRWRVFSGSMKTAEEISEEELREKARWGATFSCVEYRSQPHALCFPNVLLPRGENLQP